MMAATPWEDMDHAITAAAWGWVDEMDAPDPQRVLAFYQPMRTAGPRMRSRGR